MVLAVDQLRKSKARQVGRALTPRMRHDAALLLAELRHPLGEPRYFAARGILVNDALLGGAHDDRLGLAESGQRDGAIAGRDRILDLADEVAHARAARLVDH